MNIEEYCLSKRGAVEDYPFGDDAAVFKVNGKMFALTQPPGKPTRINLKCDPTRAVWLRQEYKSVSPGYHMNKTHWNTVELGGDVDIKEVFKMIDDSYDLVAKGKKK